MANGPGSLSSPRYAFSPVANPALSSSSVLSVNPCNLYGINAYSSVAGFLLLIDATTVPANNAAIMPRKVFAIPANGAVIYDFSLPIRFSTGCVALFSTNASPFVFTQSNTAYISGEVV